MYIFYISKYLDAHRLLIEFHVQNILDIPTVKLYIFTVHHYTEYYTYVNIIYIHMCAYCSPGFSKPEAQRYTAAILACSEPGEWQMALELLTVTWQLHVETKFWPLIRDMFI